MITERESQQFVQAKAYAEIVASPQWSVIENDLEEDIKKG